MVVVSTPITVQNVLNMPVKVLASLEEFAFLLFCGLQHRLTDINTLLHRTTFNSMANGLTGPKMMHCTIPMSKYLFSSLQALAEPSKEVTIPLVDYVVPNLHRACFRALMGNANIRIWHISISESGLIVDIVLRPV